MTLEQLLAIAEAATPGPIAGCDCCDDYGPVAPYCEGHRRHHDAVAAFGAACSPDVIVALVRVAMAAEACDRMHERSIQRAVGRGADPLYVTIPLETERLRDALDALRGRVGR